MLVLRFDGRGFERSPLAFKRGEPLAVAAVLFIAANVSSTALLGLLFKPTLLAPLALFFFPQPANGLDRSFYRIASVVMRVITFHRQCRSRSVQMADEISITKVHGVEEVSTPTTHLRVTVDTKNGPLVLKVSINAARELLAKLARLPPNLGFQSPAAKQS